MAAAFADRCGSTRTRRRRQLRRAYGGRLQQALFLVDLQLKGLRSTVRDLEERSGPLHHFTWPRAILLQARPGIKAVGEAPAPAEVSSLCASSGSTTQVTQATGTFCEAMPDTGILTVLNSAALVTPDTGAFGAVTPVAGTLTVLDSAAQVTPAIDTLREVMPDTGAMLVSSSAIFGNFGEVTPDTGAVAGLESTAQAAPDTIALREVTPDASALAVSDSATRVTPDRGTLGGRPACWRWAGLPQGALQRLAGFLGLGHEGVAVPCSSLDMVLDAAPTTDYYAGWSTRVEDFDRLDLPTWDPLGMSSPDFFDVESVCWTEPSSGQSPAAFQLLQLCEDLTDDYCNVEEFPERLTSPLFELVWYSHTLLWRHFAGGSRATAAELQVAGSALQRALRTLKATTTSDA